MLAPMDNFTAVDGVHALVMRCEQSGWYTIVAVFEVKKTIPAERIIHGR
jgi:predicted RNA polymerase sigma factor